MNTRRPGPTLLAAVAAIVLTTLPLTARAGNVAASGVGGQNCTYTIGWWKGHPDQWALSTLTLGTVTYSQAQLGLILSQPVQGNGLVSLSQQLIAAKLNVAQGADASAIAPAIAQADLLIGALLCPPMGLGWLSPAQSSVLGAQLDGFNQGHLGPWHCGSTTTTGARAGTWGAIKTFYH